MKRRDFLRLTFTMGLHAGLVGCGNGSSRNPAPIKKTHRKPNVILIISDDHGYADFSYKKIHDYIKTPNLDRFVAEGVEFTNGYATSPICSPSRCGILTGRQQQRWGTFWYGGDGIPEDVPTIAERFRSLGYRTGYIGKLHYGNYVEQPGLRSYPMEHGFDECL